jgi:glycosyltransferase involved in cell wall biosynthesis
MSAQPLPTVSVILPSFDRLQFLRPTIESVFAQTFSDWELIIADDGSSEPTRAYLRALASDARVTLAPLPHTGKPAAVRNVGVHMARGRYLAFIDSDDLWRPTKLEQQIAALRERPHCRWSYTAYRRVDEHDEVLAEEYGRIWAPCDGQIFEDVVTTRASIRTPSVVVAERELVLEVGAFDEEQTSAEDYDLWMRLALNSEVALVDEPLVLVRIHADSHSSRDAACGFAGRDYSLAKLATIVEPRWHPLLQRERARNSLRLAQMHTAMDARAPALRALWQGLPHAWPYPRWWFGAIRSVLLRPIVSRLRLRKV